MRTFESSAALNSTLLSGGPAFVSSPKTRGTLDILWPCVSILILCTWSVLHLNVPIESTPKTTSQAYGRKIYLFWIKFRWMLVNLAAPDWAVGQALGNNRSVALLEGQFEKYRRQDDVPWSRSHIYYANMGGFSLLFDQSLTHPELPFLDLDSSGSSITSSRESDSSTISSMGDTDDSSQKSRRFTQSIRRIFNNLVKGDYPGGDDIQPWTRRTSKMIGEINWQPDQYNTRALDAVGEMHQAYDLCYWREKLVLVDVSDWFQNLTYLGENRWVLDANQLLLARECGIIETLPVLSQASLDDLNKGNLFVTALAFIQILWMMIQLAVRWRQSLPTSQLEILTLSFAVCSIATYCLLLDKPKNFQTSHTIKATKRPSAEDVIHISAAGPMMSIYTRTSIQIPNNSIHRNSDTHDQSSVVFLGSTLAMVVFSAIHCIAWNFKFPTEAEKVCWHISTVISACAMPLIWAIEYWGPELL